MKIRVEDFQPFGTTEIEASGLTVLVGRSNLGKSALVRAVTAALFNRPGEGFVRRGKTRTKVTIDRLPTTTGAPLTVEWEKGHNLNQFTVNGTVYSKVGATAPVVLQERGYRDVFIGDKERNKGETIRPQVADQFDPPFLITKQGSFVNDVLSVVSRLGVLLAANGRCAKDLKANKALLTVREKDLDAADAKLAALQPVLLLHTRVVALKHTIEATKALHAKAAQARVLTAARAGLLTYCQQVLPETATGRLGELTDGAAMIARVHGLVTGRGALAHCAALTLPADVTMVPESLGQRELQARAALAQYRTAAVVKTLALPEATTVTIPSAHDVTAARPLARLRPALASLAAHALPKVLDDKLVEAAGQTGQMRTQVSGLVTERDHSTRGVYHAVAALSGVTAQETEADAALTDALAGLEICPVCERPMEQATATV